MGLGKIIKNAYNALTDNGKLSKEEVYQKQIGSLQRQIKKQNRRLKKVMGNEQPNTVGKNKQDLANITEVNGEQYTNEEIAAASDNLVYSLGKEGAYERIVNLEDEINRYERDIEEVREDIVKAKLDDNDSVAEDLALIAAQTEKDMHDAKKEKYQCKILEKVSRIYPEHSQNYDRLFQEVWKRAKNKGAPHRMSKDAEENYIDFKRQRTMDRKKGKMRKNAGYVADGELKEIQEKYLQDAQAQVDKIQKHRNTVKGKKGDKNKATNS